MGQLPGCGGESCHLPEFTQRARVLTKHVVWDLTGGMITTFLKFAAAKWKHLRLEIAPPKSQNRMKISFSWRPRNVSVEEFLHIWEKQSLLLPFFYWNISFLS